MQLIDDTLDAAINLLNNGIEISIMLNKNYLFALEKISLPSSINITYLQHCNISLVYISHMNCCYEDPVCY
jgi:hypothetical protein